MKTEIFVRRTWIEAPAETVFRWHTRPGAFERLTPPWEAVEVLEPVEGGIEDGARVTLITHIGPLPMRWIAEHCDYVEGRQFRDVQIAGPFARWEHTHRIEPDGPSACYLEDRIEYALPLGPAGRLLGGELVRQKLERLFNYRHRVTVQDITAHQTRKEGETMHILISGSTGLIGSSLIPFLNTGGHNVTRLVRSEPTPGAAEVHWSPESGRIDVAGLEGVDAVVHLAGESIAGGRWTPEQKARIRDSRIKGTRLLSETLTALAHPPKVWVCASAIGYYGDRGVEALNERSPPGSGFLAQVCREWEAEAEPAARKGIRVVNIRIGVVLSPAGGALAKMLLPFKMGVGGVIGSGKQYMSWIALDDVVGAIHHALVTDELRGPVNATTPQPVTNREFTKTLGRVLGRPTLFPLPGFAARLALGEMADELLLASARVEPTQLLKTGYPFRFSELEGALRHLLGK